MIAALLLAALLPGQAAVADPLAPAREGKLRCVTPNAARKTCQSIIRYSVTDNGGFDATVVGIIARDPTVLIRYTTFGRIEEGGVCAMIRPTDFEKGTLLEDGKPLTPNAEQQTRMEMMDAIQPIAGKKRCFIDRAADDASGSFLSVITLDGVAQPNLNQRAIWVGKDEGYAIGN